MSPCGDGEVGVATKDKYAFLVWHSDSQLSCAVCCASNAQKKKNNFSNIIPIVFTGIRSMGHFCLSDLHTKLN